MNLGVLVGGKKRDEVLEEHLARIKERSDQGAPRFTPNVQSKDNLCKIWEMEKIEGPGHFYFQDHTSYLTINALPFMGKLLQVDVFYLPFFKTGIEPISIKKLDRYGWEALNETTLEINPYGGFLVASAPFYITIFRALQAYCSPFKDGANPLVDKAKNLVRTAFDSHIVTLSTITAKRDDFRGLVIHDSNMPYETSHGIESVIHGDGHLRNKEGSDDYCQHLLGCTLDEVNALTQWSSRWNAQFSEDSYREMPAGLTDENRVLTFHSYPLGHGIRLCHSETEMPAMGVRAREIITHGGGTP